MAVELLPESQWKGPSKVLPGSKAASGADGSADGSADDAEDAAGNAAGAEAAPEIFQVRLCLLSET